MSIYLKLVKVQNELKAPKGQFNSFGKYSYRNQEDILEAVKPLLLKHGLTLFIKDDIETIGERYYVKATCTLVDVENGETVENTALAREADNKKGMDDSQITGSTSSYARKYALNGLFLIDDTKDADTDEFKKRTDNKNNYSNNNSNNNKTFPASEKQLKFVMDLLSNKANSEGKTKEELAKDVFKAVDIELKPFKEITAKEAKTIITYLNK